MKIRYNWVWFEMAHRKKRFHQMEDWKKLKLWGLFYWGDVSKYIKSGELITDDRKENKIIWVRPSSEAYYKHIKPILDTMTLEEIEKEIGLYGCYYTDVKEIKMKEIIQKTIKLIGNALLFVALFIGIMFALIFIATAIDLGIIYIIHIIEILIKTL